MSEPRALAVLIIFITALTAVDAKRVILFPAPTTSYIIYHANIASALIDLGHEVWICIPHYLLQRDLVKNKSIKLIEFGKDSGDLTTRFVGNNLVDKFWAGEDVQGVWKMLQLSSSFGRGYESTLSDKSLIDSVGDIKADLFVLDFVMFHMNNIVLPYKFDIPYAMIGTMHDVVLSRVPFSPAATPLTEDWTSDKMTFKQRLEATVFYMWTMFFEVYYDSSVLAKYAPEKPYVSIADLAARAEIFIAELDPILDYPRPMLPNTKLVGGSSVSPAKPLVGEFKEFVEQSKQGIIVVSFGGSVINVPPSITSKMASAFKQLDLRVVWRVNITSPDPSRIMTSTWIPQNDLLGHEKTKLFVSHCGKNGQYEALYHAVPILCLPIYGDQGYNAERIKIKQFGLRADMRTASTEELASLMKQIVYEDKYKANIQKASRLFRKLYKVPMKEVAYWLDHVMKYGGSYMRSSGQEMPLFQFLALDVIAFITGVVILIVLFTGLLFRLCWTCCKGEKNNMKHKKE